MAFSAFGAKPAATGSSIFGQSSGAPATQPQPSLFGNNNANTNASKPFGAFGTQTQPTQGSSIFGGQSAQQPQQQQQSILGPSLFSNTTGQQQQTPGTSSFGQTQPAQPTINSGLFGQSTGSTQPQMQQPSLFGNSTTQNQPAQSGSLFSNTTNQGLFGSTAVQPQQQTQSNLFGSSFGGGSGSNNTPLGQSTLGGFGTSTTPGMQRQPTLGGFGGGGGSMFGRQAPAQPTNLPNAPFTKTTKFNDLPDEIKKMFENIDTHIQGRIQISNDLRRRKIGEEATKGQELIRNVQKDLVNAITVLQSDVYQTRDLKSKVDQCVQDTIVGTQIVDGFRNPQQNGIHLKTHANFPLEFFQRVTEEMRDRLRWYKSTVEQIERKLASAAAQTQYTPHAITSTLEAQHAIFIALASRTAAVDAELQKIKTLYTQLWRTKTGSMRDPFNDLDRGAGGQFGLESVSGK